MVEEEINELEGKVDELRLELYQERGKARELELRQQKRVWQNDNLLCEVGNHRSVGMNDQLSRSQNYEVSVKERVAVDRRASLSSASDTRSSNSKLLCLRQDVAYY